MTGRVQGDVPPSPCLMVLDRSTGKKCLLIIEPCQCPAPTVCRWQQLRSVEESRVGEKERHRYRATWAGHELSLVGYCPSA